MHCIGVYGAAAAYTIYIYDRVVQLMTTPTGIRGYGFLREVLRRFIGIRPPGTGQLLAVRLEDPS
jgi:hypothetical protein